MANLVVLLWNKLDATEVQGSLADCDCKRHPKAKKLHREWMEHRRQLQEATIGYTAATLDIQASSAAKRSKP